MGKLDLDKSLWPHLAASLEARISGRKSLFEDDPLIKETAEKAMRHYDFLATNKRS